MSSISPTTKGEFGTISLACSGKTIDGDEAFGWLMVLSSGGGMGIALENLRRPLMQQRLLLSLQEREKG